MTNATECQRTATLARLASFCGLNAAESVYVPATVEVFLKSARGHYVGAETWTEQRMVNELFGSKPLRSYFVECIRKAVAKDAE